MMWRAPAQVDMKRTGLLVFQSLRPFPWQLLLAATIALFLVAGSVLLGQKGVSAASTGPSFIEFESGPVRPLAISPDRSTLFAVNTPNGTLEVVDLRAGRLAFRY